jgi:hypothetical protein
MDIVTINGKTNVADRPVSGEPRYKVGDWAVVLDEGLLLPEWLLRHNDLWDEEKGKGRLAGPKGNRTKARRMANVQSEVALFKVQITNGLWFEKQPQIEYPIDPYYGAVRADPCGEDMSDWLQITPYKRPE